MAIPVRISSALLTTIAANTTIADLLIRGRYLNRLNPDYL